MDGARWRFYMTSKGPSGIKLTGSYRINNHVLYQKEKRTDVQMDKKVGTNFPINKKRTKTEFADLRVMDLKSKEFSQIKGTARLKMVEGGKWSGGFTDGKGMNWSFTCRRVQE